MEEFINQLRSVRKAEQNTWGGGWNPVVPVTWTEVPQIMGSQAVLMAQLAYTEGIPGEFITKASNDTDMFFKLLCGDLEFFGHKQVHASLAGHSFNGRAADFPCGPLMGYHGAFNIYPGH